jgi:hypothetical protein
MTNYVALTGIPAGHTAFTATYRPEAEIAALAADAKRREHNRIKSEQKRMRLKAKRVNQYSDIGRSTGPSNSETAPR